MIEYGGYPVFAKIGGKKALCRALKWRGKKANLKTITRWEVDCPVCNTTFNYVRGKDFVCPNCKTPKDKNWKIEPAKAAAMDPTKMADNYSFNDLREIGYQYDITGRSAKSLAKKIVATAKKLLK